MLVSLHPPHSNKTCGWDILQLKTYFGKWLNQNSLNCVPTIVNTQHGNKIYSLSWVYKKADKNRDFEKGVRTVVWSAINVHVSSRCLFTSWNRNPDSALPVFLRLTRNMTSFERKLRVPHVSSMASFYTTFLNLLTTCFESCFIFVKLPFCSCICNTHIFFLRVHIVCGISPSQIHFDGYVVWYLYFQMLLLNGKWYHVHRFITLINSTRVMKNQNKVLA